MDRVDVTPWWSRALAVDRAMSSTTRDVVHAKSSRGTTEATEARAEATEARRASPASDNVEHFASLDAEIAANSVRTSVLTSFATWFVARGGAIDARVRMVFRPDRGWSLEADANASAGERLVFLPRRAMMTCEDESVSESLRDVIARVPKELWSSKLGLVLIRERVAGAASTFAPYVNLLPSVHEGNPTFFAPDAIREFQYAPLVAQVNKRCRFLVQFAGRAFVVDDGPDYVDGQHPERRRVEMEIDANALGWASACASSRAFKVRGPTSTPSMLPVIDVCNHSFSPSAAVRVVDGSDGDVELVTTRDIAAGEAIELSYGELSNDDLLLDYGFIVEDNPFDVVKLRWDVKLIELAREIGGLAAAPIGAKAAEDERERANVGSESDDVIPITPWQRAALQRIGLTDDATRVGAELDIRSTNQVVDKKLLAGLRVLYSKSPVEASRAADAPYGELNADVVSRDTEIKALRTCMALVALALGNFPTTLDDDLKLLATASASSTAQHVLAIRFRAEKKKILSKAMGKLNEAVARAQR